MATDTKTTTFTFDEKALRAHIDKVIEYHNQFVGKKSYNPFFYIVDTINPLVKRLRAGEQTKELHDAIMALPLKDNAPVVSKAVEPPLEKLPPQLITQTNTGEVGLTTPKAK